MVPLLQPLFEEEVGSLVVVVWVTQLMIVGLRSVGYPTCGRSVGYPTYDRRSS